MKRVLHDFCPESGKGHLLDQWDTVANLPDTPKTISYGSRKQVWWVCGQGHSWQAMVQNRTARDTQCPVCTGKQAPAVFSDLASQYPHLAAQWHPTKNLPLTPESVTANSNRSVWWRCDQGHTWMAKIYARTGAQRTGCPICAGLYKTKCPGDQPRR